ncbi:hypothetical protein [uncultured Tenacibaculum sp.]|uniref:hypothetical protein n=1 Tax=uncultured Tenacibaculum sp. TaxID=174713 RepID=UPI002626B51A|nr:hypothetical protein [uncultured Tenacibaculum sp.]
MTVSQKLDSFYIENNLAEHGGENENFFYLHFKLFSLKLPNSEFRKKVVYIHDIQHVLFDCDTTWKGEAYIAGWEIATGIWKHLPIGIMSIWAMGFSLLFYPKEVIDGYKKGLHYNGLIDQEIDKSSIMNLTVDEVNALLLKKTPTAFNRLKLTFWIIFSVGILISPLLLMVILWFLF